MGKSRSAKVVIMFIVLVFVASGCTSKEEKVEHFISKGDALMVEGDSTRAILEYKNALQIAPKNVDVMFSLGKAYLSQKEYRKAYGTFRTALELNPDYDKARVEVASIVLLGKQGEKVLEELKLIKNPEKFGLRVHIIRARALIFQGKYLEAIDLLSKIMDGDKNKDVQILLSLCFKETAQHKMMKDAVKKWRQIDAKDPASYAFMVQYAAEQGNKAEAGRQLEAMVRANPTEINLQLFRAQALERLGLMEDATKAFENLPSDPRMMKARAGFWRRQGKNEKEKKILEEIIVKDPEDIEAAVRLAEILAVTGRIEEAYKELDKTLGKKLSKEDHEKVIVAKATLKASQGKLEEAQSLCEGVLKENQGMMDAHFLLGKILLARGKLDKAEIHLNQVAVARPGDAKAQILLARCQLLNKKESVAGNTLKNVLKKTPANQQLRLELVRYHLIKKEYDQAINILDKGLILNEKNIPFLKTRGEIEAFRKKYDEAEKDFRHILNLRPDIPLGFMEMGRLVLAEGKKEEALKWFKKAYGTKNGWQIAIPALVGTYVGNNDIDSALRLVKEEVQKRPKSAIVYYYLGKTLVLKGDLEKAAEAFSKATDLAPKWPQPYRGLGEVYLRQGKISEALAKVEELYNKSPSLAAGMNLAVLYEYKGQYNDAIKTYRALLEKYGESPIILNNLAYLYAEHSENSKDLEKARDMVAQALAQEPDNASFLDTAAWIEYKLGKFNSAWSYLQDALSKSPEMGIVQLHASIVAHKLGQTEQALDYLEKAIEQKLDPQTRKKAMALKEKWK
ncbi:MAG: tetratricopeptide repeat protein [Deltaproteobacteria bacterium]|nr:tetratricopeptide repeat protein [Deltaproteobacteria bacterium]